MPMDYAFDARQFEPVQSVGTSHPPGKYPFTISNTSIEPTKDNTGGMFVVAFTTPQGMISKRYNLWNNSPKAVEIAHKELSALCHATGVFQLTFKDDGAALRNAQGMIEVDWQKGNEPTAEKPHGGYTEVKKVLDRNGNEPGKAPAAAPQTVSATGGGWGNQGQQAQPGWQNGPAPVQQGQPQQQAPQQQPSNAGWQPGPTQGQAPAQEKPPWAR